MSIVNLDIVLCTKLNCGNCDDVIMQLNDPTLLLENQGAPVDEIKTFVRASIVSFEKVLLNCQQCYRYIFSYDDAILLDPLTPLRDCDVDRICCVDCMVAYIDELDYDHTISSSDCGLLRLTRPDSTFDDVIILTCTTLPILGTGLSGDPVDLLISGDAGNILSLGSDNGLYASPHTVEVITTLVDNGDNTFTYTSEDSTITTVDFGHSLSRVGNNVRLTKPDGTTNDAAIGHTLSEPVPNTVRLTRPDGSFDDVLVSFSETITTLVNNGNDTFTYTSENSTVTNFNAAHTLTKPSGKVIRLTRPSGTFDEVTLTDTTVIGANGMPGGSPVPFVLASSATFTSTVITHVVNAPADRGIVCDAEISFRPSFIYDSKTGAAESVEFTQIIEVQLNGGGWVPVTTQLLRYELTAGNFIQRPELHNERQFYSIAAGGSLTIEARYRIVCAVGSAGVNSTLDDINGSISSICSTT